MDADYRDTDNDSPIDETTIQELREEGEDLLSDLVAMFIEEVPGRLAELEEALARKDPAATRLAAHTLKGHRR